MKVNKVGEVRTLSNGSACVLFKQGSYGNVGLKWLDLQVFQEKVDMCIAYEIS